MKWYFREYVQYEGSQEFGPFDTAKAMNIALQDRKDNEWSVNECTDVMGWEVYKRSASVAIANKFFSPPPAV